MDLYQFLKFKTIETNGILSHLSRFLAIEDSDIKQDNKENKESIVLEKNETIDIFKYIYAHDKLKLIFRNAIESEEPIHILLTES